MAFSLVLCGRFASGGLTIIAIISSINRTAQPGRGNDYLTTTEKVELFLEAKSISYTIHNLHGTHVPVEEASTASKGH
jgi:hypothetical protein